MENALQPIIMAQKVRIYPYSQYDRTVCLRAELIGCIWDGEFCFVLFIFDSCFRGLSKKKNLCPPPKMLNRGNFPCFPTLFCVCDKVFNLIVETYATQTFPVRKINSHLSLLNGKIIKRIKSKQKLSTEVELAN